MTYVALQRVTANDVRRKNRTLYDHTSGPIWRRVVYDGVHDGREFINLGGRRLLDRIIAVAAIRRGASVLEIGCGRGATCRYLADACGCTVTGIDINPHQVEAAHAAGLARDGLRFIDADILEWQPDRPYDAVVSIDTFMLLPDPARALATARRALSQGGSLSVSAIGAGPALDESLREWLWTSDGMLTLLDPDAYARLCQDAGFDRVSVEELTDDAIDASARMVIALDEARDAILAREGRAAFDDWRGAADIYLHAFRTGALRYALVAGAAPRVRNGGEDADRGRAVV